MDGTRYFFLVLFPLCKDSIIYSISCQLLVYTIIQNDRIAFCRTHQSSSNMESRETIQMWLFKLWSPPANVLILLLLLSRFSRVRLCDPIDGSPPGSTVPGILQARTLEWVAISFSNAGKWKVKVKSLRRVRLFATPWTAAYQAPASMGFSRQEYWNGVPLPSPVHSPKAV